MPADPLPRSFLPCCRVQQPPRAERHKLFIGDLARSLLFPEGMRRIPLMLAVALLSSCGRPAIDPAPIRPTPAAPSPAADEQNPLLIIAVDVGQGDATLIVSPTGEAALIDAGPPGAGRDAVLPLLDSLGVTGLEFVIVTHFHEDHFGGVPELLEGPDGQVGTADDLDLKGGIYDRGELPSPPESPLFPLYAASIAGRRKTLHPGEPLRLGDVDLQALAAGGVLSDGTALDIGDPPDENAAGIPLLIEYAGFRMFIAGDITGGGGTEPFQTPDVETALGALVGDIDVLRAAHHGSHTSTNAAFLAATAPEAALISVGDGNDYGHPHRAVIERLLGAGIAVYQTERGWLKAEGPLVANGNVAIEVDRDGSWSVNAE